MESMLLKEEQTIPPVRYDKAAKNLDSTKSAIPSSKVVQFINKEPSISVTGEKLPEIDDLIYHLRAATNLTNKITRTVKSTESVAYDISTMKLEGKIKEAETAMKKKYQTNLIYYKYYTAVWSFCALLLGVFVTAGISGSIGPFSSVTGAIFSIAGIISAFIDMKDRVDKYV
ncbi:hypothetical protein ACFOZY_03255 [Chungangia koreensis]|uniref:Uncharacterized protein n=1 Tax=Chungangia koreensis TaxID=752657 RepID=A0ABV8X144_9LACT